MMTIQDAIDNIRAVREADECVERRAEQEHSVTWLINSLTRDQWGALADILDKVYPENIDDKIHMLRALVKNGRL